MKILASLIISCFILLFSCTDRDDNLEGLQIRVQNKTGKTFSEVVIDSLVFAEIKPGDLTFYQRKDSLLLPQQVLLKSDSLVLNVAIDTIFELDSIGLNLFTYRIKGLSEGMEAEIEVLKD